MIRIRSTSFGIGLAMMVCVTPAGAWWTPSVPGSSSSSVSSVTPIPVKGSITFPVLTFHYVENVMNKADKGRIRLDIVPQVFEKQLQALQEKKYQTYFIAEIPGVFGGTVPVSAHRIALTFDDGYEDFYTDVLPLLEKYQMKATLYVVNDFLDKPGYLTTKQLKEIAMSGLVEIGAHSLHHKNLTSLSLEQAMVEIADSKMGLEQLLGLPVQTFAYPYGKHSPRIDALAAKAGFRAAVTTERGFVQSSDHLFTIQRISAGAFLGQRKWKTIGES